MVKADLSLLELSLSWIESCFIEGLDRVGYVGMYVDGGVDHSIRSYSQYACELQPVG